jgi:adenylate kinase
MNIALIGPSLAGKGTQADKLIPEFDLLHIAAGDIFRESLENQTALGVLAQKYMDQGELVPDDVVEAMVEEFVRKADPKKGILFDGFPRTMYQAKFLDDLLKEAGRELDAIIYLKVSKDEVIKRLPGRVICRKCQSPFHKVDNPFQLCAYNACQGEHLYQRDDDNPETIRARLRVFHREAATLIDYYQQSGKLIIVDGERNIEQVHGEIMAALEAVRRSEGRPATFEEAQQITALKDVRLALSREQAKHRSLDVVLLGAPGSGKGTQAVQLGKLFNIRRIATGDLFRKNIEEETKLGKLAKKYMDRGELVPDNVTEAMVRERLSRQDTRNGFILDGFPRTLPQAEALTEIMTDMHRRIDLVIYLKVPDDEIIERLSGRLICQKCQSPFHKIYNPFQSCPYNQCAGEYLYQREDDRPETVGNRLRTFHRQTAPLIQYYNDAGLLVEIDGVGEVMEVFERTLAVVRKVIEAETV